MPWTPGESGNLDGAKRPRKFQAALDRALAADDGKRLRRCVETILDLAAEGERWAVELLRDTLDGRPAQSIVATDDDGRPLAIGLIAYASSPEVRPDDPVSIQPKALPTPDIEGTGQRH